jgi:hypothetical protein
LQLLKRQPFPQFYPNIYQKTWITSIFLGRFCELGMVKRLWSQHETHSHLGTLPSHDSFFWHPFLADHWVISFFSHVKVVDLLNVQCWTGGPWIPQTKIWIYKEQSLGTSVS